MMTAKQIENTGSVIKSQARKRKTSQKRKNAKIIFQRVMAKKPSVSIRKANQIAKISYNLTRLKNDFRSQNIEKKLICMINILENM
jgi:hypothetical protein